MQPIEVKGTLICGLSPFYLLVVTYASIHLILHMSEYFLYSVRLSFLLWISLFPAGLIGYDVCLSDIQQRRSELLQLTAGYTHQRSVQTGEAKHYAHAEEWCNDLQMVEDYDLRKFFITIYVDWNKAFFLFAIQQT